jgi:uncharacterized protein (TIGR00251 family)
VWYEFKDDRVIISVKAVPASSKNLVSGLLDESLKLKIKAPAVDGAANKELVKFLSKILKVAKSDIIFVGGVSSKRKRLSVPLNDRVKQFIKEIEDDN